MGVNIGDVHAGLSLCVPGQPDLHSEFMTDRATERKPVWGGGEICEYNPLSWMNSLFTELYTPVKEIPPSFRFPVGRSHYLSVAN